LTIDEQIERIKRGTVEIIPEEELRGKLERAAKEGRPLRVKLGLDPTAPDIHLGTAVVLRKMRLFQDLGHEVFIIIGDFTASIGDPSGVSVTRPMLSREEIEANAKTYYDQYTRILMPERTHVVFNSQWLAPLTFADVIRITSKVTVARVLERDDFETRLRENRPIGLHELLYPIAQAYDSVQLKADIEVGGTDQKFNILMGRQLQEAFGQEPQIGLFMPILPGIDGVQKMSKSLGNYIGVAEPPKEMFGKTMSIPDQVIPIYFELTTDVPMEEVREIERGLAEGRLHPMEVKKRLAREIVKIYHGEEAAWAAQREFERVFSQREVPENIPEVVVPRSAFRDGRVWIVRLLVVAGMAPSNAEARRLVIQGAVELDGERVTDTNAEIEVREGQILRAGKLRFARLRPE